MPGGGATLALRATAGDGEVELDWLEPDTGGLTITQYIVQWRADGQAFSTGRQATISGALTAYTRDTLTNGTAYFFQVRARNSSGVWTVVERSDGNADGGSRAAHAASRTPNRARPRR